MSNNNSNSQGSKVADFMLQLYLILMGIAFGYSVENLVADKITISSVFRFFTVVVLLIIWLHGQVGYGLSETYDVGYGWLSRVIENYIEIAGAMLIMTAALVQNNEIVFYSIVLASYAFDFILEGSYIRRLRDVREKYKREYEVAQSWMYVDFVAVLLIVLMLVLRINWKIFSELPASISVLIVVLTLSLWDYSYNRDFYFGLSRSKQIQK